MFENLLHQEEAETALRSGAANGKLPRSLLFHGPFASGKTTAALELARVLSCEGDSGWNCACGQCERHRRIAHPDLLIAGPDAFAEELQAALDGLSRAQGRRELFAFLRAARRLVRRFDPELWEGEEQKLAKAAPSLYAIDELLPAVDPARALAGPSPEAPSLALESALKIGAEAAKLIPAVPQSIPVFQVRNAIRWAQLSSASAMKTLIVENAETMLDSARNAFLKLLEEPPAGVCVVLCTTRRSALLETILSRLRPVAFKERGLADSRDALRRVFGLVDPEQSSVGEYLEGFRRPLNGDIAEAAARAVRSSMARASLAMGIPTPPELLEEGEAEIRLPEDFLDREPFQRLCRALLGQLSAALRLYAGGKGFDLMAAVAATRGEAVRKAAQRAAVLNQSPQALSWSVLEAMEALP